MYDVIVVGARCAGAPLAMLLARRGARVLLVDRARFPCDIPHGHFIHRHGPRRLRTWGLFEQLAVRTPGVASMILDVAISPCARAPGRGRHGVGGCVRGRTDGRAAAVPK